MRKLKLFFACLLMAVLSIGQVWAADATDVVAMKGFASITADGYQNITKSGESENGIDMVAYGYIGSSGQVRGSKTAIAGASVTSSDANKNWSLYNSEAMPGAISKIVVTQTATGTNKFQNTLYVSLGTSSQGSVTTVTSAQAQDNTSGAQTITFTIDATKNYTYFKLLSTAKFTSGSVSDVKVTITYDDGQGGSSNPTV